VATRYDAFFAPLGFPRRGILFPVPVSAPHTAGKPAGGALVAKFYFDLIGDKALFDNHGVNLKNLDAARDHAVTFDHRSQGACCGPWRH
jgi:hypothetical protein